MPLEVATYIGDLVPANPSSTDNVTDGDNHTRLIKQTLWNTFPNINEPVTKTAEEINDGITAALAAQAAPQVIPAGIISMWSGAISDIPAGWDLCDGTIFFGGNT